MEASTPHKRKVCGHARNALTWDVNSLDNNDSITGASAYSMISLSANALQAAVK